MFVCSAQFGRAIVGRLVHFSRSCMCRMRSSVPYTLWPIFSGLPKFCMMINRWNRSLGDWHLIMISYDIQFAIIYFMLPLQMAMHSFWICCDVKREHEPVFDAWSAHRHITSQQPVSASFSSFILELPLVSFPPGKCFRCQAAIRRPNWLCALVRCNVPCIICVCESMFVRACFFHSKHSMQWEQHWW